MILIITLTTAGTDTGPFNLYSDVDGYISAFEVGVPKIDLVAGYTSYVVPDGTTMVRIMSAGTCKNYIDLPAITTTTTTTTCSLPDVTIGDQIWTGCNLSVTTYRNGDPIPEVTDPTAWSALTTGAWCYYNNDPANAATYGRLYNWYAVNDPRGLAPVGYHVPTDAEWTTLTTFLGGLSVAGGPLKEAGTDHWNSPNTDATNSSGFTGLPGGWNNYYGSGTFQGINNTGYWWSSTPYFTGQGWSYVIFYNLGIVYRVAYYVQQGMSVRLIKD